MSEKKLTEEELNQVAGGGAKFSLASQAAAGHEGLGEGVPRGVIVDPWGGVEPDPPFGDVLPKLNKD